MISHSLIRNFFATLIALPSVLHAATVVTPVGATSTSTVGGSRTIDKVIDGSGLFDVSDPSSVLDDRHVYDTNAYWLSVNGAVGAGTEVLEFDLGGSYDINGLWHWKYTREADRPIKTFDISYSTDGGTNWTIPVAATSLGMTDWTTSLGTREDSYAEFRSFNTLVGATDIRFSNLQNYGDPGYFALFEIRFSAVPEPSAALLGGFGLLMLLRRRRA